MESHRPDCEPSTQQCIHGSVIFDSGQPHVETLKLIRQAFVIDTQTFKNRGVQLVNVDRILYHVVAEVVRFSVNQSWFHTDSRLPDGETFRVVVAAIVLVGQLALAIDRATKFATPDDQSVVQHSAHF